MLNIIPIMQRNQRSISPQLNLFRSNAMQSPQNKINPNSIQKIPNQNNININNNLITGNVQRNFIPKYFRIYIWTV